MRTPRIATIAACALLGAGLLHAQTVYKIVGPDGKVTFSDRAPDNAKASTVDVAGTGGASAASNAALPATLRKPAGQFPVTLYTSADCTPCNSARNLLINRGVPFTERSVTSNADLHALKRLSGDTNLPFGTIGQQQLKGFSDTDWTSYLDAAGYPRQSQLPAGYKHPAATPLVAATPASAAPADPAKPAEETRRRAPRPTAPASGPNPSNPAGIIF